MAAVQATYIPGAQHHEVTADDPEYQKIKLELENAGLVLIRLVKLTNTVLAEMFQTEADHLVRFRPRGKHLFLIVFMFCFVHCVSKACTVAIYNLH